MKNRIFTLISTLVISGGLCLFGLEYANALVVRGDCGQSWAPNEGITRISNRAISNQFIWYGKPFTGTETTYEHETKTSDRSLQITEIIGSHRSRITTLIGEIAIRGKPKIIFQ